MTKGSANGSARMGVRGWLLAGAFLLAGLLAAFHPMLFSDLQRIQTDEGDTRLVNYILEHSYRWAMFSLPIGGLWSPPIFYPAPNVGAYTDILLGVAPYYWPWRWLGLPPDTAYQFWMMLVVALDFAAMFALLRRGFSLSAFPSAVGAYLFSFGSPRITDTGHQQLLSEFYSVAAVYALLRVFSPDAGKRKRLWIAAFFAAVVLELWSGFYLGWFLVFLTTLALIWAIARPEYRADLRQLWKEHRRAIVLCSFLSLFALLPMAGPYLQALAESGPRCYQDVRDGQPRIASWICVPPEHWLYGRLIGDASLFRHLSGLNEQRMGVGFITLAMALVGLWWGRRERSSRLLFFVFVTAVIGATFHPIGQFVWNAVYHAFPGASAIRAVARIGIPLLLPLGLGVALFLERMRSRWPAWALALCGLAVAAEQGVTTGAYPKQAPRLRVAAIAARVTPGSQAFFCSSSGVGGYIAGDQLDAMWAQLSTGVPTLNGYSGNAPPGWQFTDLESRYPGNRRALEFQLSEWSHRWGLDRSKICWIVQR